MTTTRCEINKVLLSTESINTIKKLLELDNEVTCPVDIKDDYLIFDFTKIKEGGVSNGRKYIIVTAEKNIFHTHPYSSKGYPSAEDIIKLLKHHDEICHSFIVTSWGLWIISNTPGSNFYQEKNENEHNKIYKYLTDMLNKLYPIGMFRDKYIQITPDLSEFINNIFDKISRSLRLNIRFISWDNMGKS